MEKISVVIPTRFTDEFPRSTDRIKFCLGSLRNQTISSQFIEIVVSDFGSEAKYLPLLQESCQQFSARFIHFETREIWNRAKALNLGIKNSSPIFKYILATDIDIIFKNICLEKILSSMNDKRIVVCEMRDLPKMEFPEPFNPQTDLGKLETVKAVGREKGFGVCCYPRDWIFKIRGYDELFKGWGGEDDDLMKRSRLDKMQEIRLYHLAFHQWHKPLYNAQVNLQPRKDNWSRLRSLDTVIRNENVEWGKWK